MVNYIWVTNEKEMIHNYPNAPNAVSFLRNEHRHLFKFKTYLEIFHEDRDLEFIIVKRYIDSILNQINIFLGEKSCEMISRELARRLQIEYPKRDIMVEVSEDNENGVLYNYPKSKDLNTIR